MSRLRNRATGVVVNVSDETAAALPASEWESAEKPAKRSRKASADDSE